jgi:hypothetical protein
VLARDGGHEVGELHAHGVAVVIGGHQRRADDGRVRAFVAADLVELLHRLNEDAAPSAEALQPVGIGLRVAVVTAGLDEEASVTVHDVVELVIHAVERGPHQGAVRACGQALATAALHLPVQRSLALTGGLEHGGHRPHKRDRGARLQREPLLGHA